MSDVSAIVPVHGAAPYLYEALVSLGGNHAFEVEIVVVEDGTSDLDEEALVGTRVLHVQPAGRSAARNAGVEAASAPFVAFLDADDVSLPGRLQRQRTALLDAPEAVLCFGAVDAVGPDSTRLDAETAAERERFAALVRRRPTYESLLVDCPIYTSATMVVRDAFLEAGGYDTAIDAFEDLDLYLRLTRVGTLLPLGGAPVACHRRHAGNTSADALFEGMLRVIEKHLPNASGRSRRLLLRRQADSLWALGKRRQARRAALSSIRTSPALLGDPRFLKRLVTTVLVPGPMRR